MDIFEILFSSGLITGAIVLYLIVFKKQTAYKENYRAVGKYILR